MSSVPENPAVRARAPSEGRGQRIRGEAVVTVNADCGRWADVRALFEMPKTQDEETIAQRLKSASLHYLEPRWIRLIDKSRWFGCKFEVELED